MMQRTTYPYCPHGAYVGGCGIDHLCHWCEMGDPEPTLEEQQSYVRYVYSSRCAQLAPLLNHTLSPRGTASVIISMSLRDALRSMSHKLNSEIDAAREIERWSEGDDDPNWIYNRHASRAHEWDQMDGQDQFNNLPAFVLDGP